MEYESRKVGVGKDKTGEVKREAKKERNRVRKNTKKKVTRK